MNGSLAAPSPDLLAANQRLHQLRAQAQLQRPANLSLSCPPEKETVETPPLLVAFAALPDHLGWESVRVTAVLRQHHTPNQEPVPNHHQQPLDPAPPIPSLPTQNTTGPPPFACQTAPRNAQSTPPAWVKLYPDIGLMMLRQEFSASGRLWLMLRYLDTQGQGVVNLQTAYQQLTTKSSALRLCGKRQMRNLLRDGEGLYWTQRKGFIWLHSAVRVAAALGVQRLTGWPVALPVSALLSGIGAFRAHLYAAFHSGRAKVQDDRTVVRLGMPIARDTLAELSGTAQSSQRNYEARVGLRKKANYAIGPALTETGRQEQAWQHGQALFELKDHEGQQGKQGKTYLAWQLPNSYSGQHQQRPKGRQKRMNRQLKDLVTKGMPGNIENAVNAQRPEKRYFPTARLAVQNGDNKRRGESRGRRYWPQWQGGTHSAIWHPLTEGG
jgi:hypothetical protein